MKFEQFDFIKLVIKQWDNIKHIIVLTIFIILFYVGITLMFNSHKSTLATFESMNLAGAIISIFSGIGFLLEYFYKKKK
jgi:L-cystine uptake protein TcyP (sodium:dicarboxylate symporter family)